MAANPTVSDLRKISEVTDDEITAAVDAVLADLSTKASSLMRSVQARWVACGCIRSRRLNTISSTDGRYRWR